MKNQIKIIHLKLILIISITILFGCNSEKPTIKLPSNILNYKGNPTSPQYRNSLAFSDRGAWFAYGFPTETKYYGGFSGPFLMTQENGVWCSPVLSQLKIKDVQSEEMIRWKNFEISKVGYNSHLQQVYENERLKITQTLFFHSPHTALIKTNIENISNQINRIQPVWEGNLFLNNLNINRKNNVIEIISEKSTAKGFIKALNDNVIEVTFTDSTYQLYLDEFEISPRESKDLLISNTFIFPEYDVSKEMQAIESFAREFSTQLQKRIQNKEKQLQVLYQKLDKNWNKDIYKKLVAKTVLTLRIRLVL